MAHGCGVCESRLTVGDGALGAFPHPLWSSQMTPSLSAANRRGAGRIKSPELNIPAS